MAKVIGLTGGIGSGKTTVAKLFLSSDIPVYIADLEARKLMESELILGQIKKVFGEGVFDENGALLRSRLSEIVFNDTKRLEELNGIVHPVVKQDFRKWLTNHKKFDFVVYESAILFENGSYKECDYIINVTAPLEIRIQRVIKRDNTTREKVLDRIKNQLDDDVKSSKSDFVIENNSMEETATKVVEILKILRIKQIKS